MTPFPRLHAENVFIDFCRRFAWDLFVVIRCPQTPGLRARGVVRATGRNSIQTPFAKSIVFVLFFSLSRGGQFVVFIITESIVFLSPNKERRAQRIKQPMFGLFVAYQCSPPGSVCCHTRDCDARPGRCYDSPSVWNVCHESDFLWNNGGNYRKQRSHNTPRQLPIHSHRHYP